MDMSKFMPGQEQQQQGNNGGLPEGFNAGFGVTVDVKAAKGFEAFPAGLYECVITEAKPEVFKTGNSGLKLTVTVRDDVQQPFEGAKKRKVFSNLVATNDAINFWHQAAVAIGKSEGYQITNIVDFGKELLNKPVLAKIGQKVYNGENQNDVKALMPSKVTAAMAGSALTNGLPTEPFNTPNPTSAPEAKPENENADKPEGPNPFV